MAKREVPIKSQKIWDLEDTKAADGGLPIDTDLRGEIHPDLIRFKGYWYCGLKESPLGRMRLIRSKDGDKWESVRVFKWGEGELRSVGDAKFSITPDGALMITTFCKGAIDEINEHGRKKPWCASVTWLSNDGLDWGHAHVCPTGFENNWSVRYFTTWYHGRGYNVDVGTGNLYVTLDGKNWRVQTPDIFSTWDAPKATDEMLNSFDPNDIQQGKGEAPRKPNEAVIVFDEKDGTAYVIARTHPIFAIIGKAKAPDYQEWSWQPTLVDWDADGKVLPANEKLGVQMGGPVFKYLSNGVLIAAGRADASTPEKPKGRLTLFIVDPEKAILKRWGDFDGWSHYPGVVEYEDELWITCGRQQRQDPFAVYLLKTPLPQPGD